MAKPPLEYPPRYCEAYPRGAAPLEDQIERLGLLLDLPTSAARAYARYVSTRCLPIGAEGLFASVRHEAVAKDYPEAVSRVLFEMYLLFYGPRYTFDVSSFTGMNARKRRLQEEAESKTQFNRAVEGQESPIVIFPAQFGRLYAGAPGQDIRDYYRQARNDVFGLGLFTAYCMLITHPERLAPGALGIGCPGDQCAYDENIALDYIPGIIFNPTTGHRPHISFDNKRNGYRSMGMLTGFLFAEETHGVLSCDH